jgi:glycerol-3-phosphate acyltransferase PlsY
MLAIISATIFSYLLGAIPTAYIFGRLLKGVDIRKAGSGNVGATNAMRVLGKGPGALVLLLDILKGFIAVRVIANTVPSDKLAIPYDLFALILGIACIVGHNWTVFLRFSGGKGVATTLGVLAGLSCSIACLRWPLLALLLTWISVFLLFRIISLASVIAAFSFPVYVVIFKAPRQLFAASIIFSAFVILRHRSNILRLLAGKEQKIFPRQ